MFKDRSLFARYFDSNRDMKLEFVELKELMAAVRTVRQLPVDALSVAREADLVLRYLPSLTWPQPYNCLIEGKSMSEKCGSRSLFYE